MNPNREWREFCISLVLQSLTAATLQRWLLGRYFSPNIKPLFHQCSTVPMTHRGDFLTAISDREHSNKSGGISVPPSQRFKVLFSENTVTKVIVSLLGAVTQKCVNVRWRNTLLLILQVNLDFKTKEATSQNIERPIISTFDAAQSTVYRLMEQDSYPRFLRSDPYLSLVRGRNPSSRPTLRRRSRSFTVNDFQGVRPDFALWKKGNSALVNSS